MNFHRVNVPYRSFTIEFLEGGKLCINDNGETSTYPIYNNVNIDDGFSTYARWHNSIGYGKKKNNNYFFIDYYSEDSVKISKIPHDLAEYYGDVSGNIFYRVE